MGKFLDQAGALYIITKIKGLLNDKVDKEKGKMLTDVNFTASLKEKLDNIEAGANKYSHPNTSGNKHIPTGGKTGQILRWSSDGTASWGEDKDTTYAPMTPASTTETGKGRTCASTNSRNCKQISEIRRNMGSSTGYKI